MLFQCLFQILCLRRYHNTVVIEEEAKRFLQHLAPELHCQNSHPHQHPVREPSDENVPAERPPSVSHQIKVIIPEQ